MVLESTRLWPAVFYFILIFSYATGMQIGTQEGQMLLGIAADMEKQEKNVSVKKKTVGHPRNVNRSCPNHTGMFDYQGPSGQASLVRAKPALALSVTCRRGRKQPHGVPKSAPRRTMHTRPRPRTQAHTHICTRHEGRGSAVRAQGSETENKKPTKVREQNA